MPCGGYCSSQNVDKMKFAVILLFVFCYAECRKMLVQIDKNANLAFINMEGGGGTRPGGNTKPLAPPQAPTPKPGAPVAQPTPANPVPTPVKPAVVPVPTPAKAASAPAKPSPQPTKPTEIKPVPVNPAPAANPITTPGPGSVKHLINFYDSQGKGSPIRPYSYSQAVKQG